MVLPFYAFDILFWFRFFKSTLQIRGKSFSEVIISIDIIVISIMINSVLEVFQIDNILLVKNFAKISTGG